MRVSELYLYPIKSCRGIRLDRLPFGPLGPLHDRAWMVTTPGGEMIAQAKHPRLCLVDTRMDDDGALTIGATGAGEVRISPDITGKPRLRARIRVENVDAVDEGDAAAEWFSTHLGMPVRLVRIDSTGARFATRLTGAPLAFADLASVLVVSTASLADLNTRLETPLPMNRFRPNIVVEDCVPYAEDEWKKIRVGDVTLKGMFRCARCAVTTNDQATAERTKEPLRSLAKYRKPALRGGPVFGMYFAYVTGEAVRVGDKITLL